MIQKSRRNVNLFYFSVPTRNLVRKTLAKKATFHPQGTFSCQTTGFTERFAPIEKIIAF